jgi:organic hydroperoxide reductase OsmC/OhrA
MRTLFDADQIALRAPAYRSGMEPSPTFRVEIEQQEGFEFRVRFDWPDVPGLVLDEPEPLGQRAGPNAARLVAAAVANCLAASLVFCLKSKYKQDPAPVRATATGRLRRNMQGRYRIAGIDVEISLAETWGAMPHQERCLEQFEDFCVVTQSIRAGIPVSVTVRDATGAELARSAETTAKEIPA